LRLVLYVGPPHLSWMLLPPRVVVLFEKLEQFRLRSTSARDARASGGRLARASSSAAKGSLLPLLPKPFPSLGLSLLLALSSLAVTIGRAAAPFVTSSPSPLPTTSILQVCPPPLFPSAMRYAAPQTLTKLFVFGSESSYNILPTNFDFVSTHVVCWVRPCSTPSPALDLRVASVLCGCAGLSLICSFYVSYYTELFWMKMEKQTISNGFCLKIPLWSGTQCAVFKGSFGRASLKMA